MLGAVIFRWFCGTTRLVIGPERRRHGPKPEKILNFRLLRTI
jgi:hypothetical protein